MKRIFSLLLCSLFIALFSVPVHAVTTVSFQDGTLPDASYSGAEDAYVRQSSPFTSYGSDPVLLADGSDQDPDNGKFGEVVTLLNWDISSIPQGVTVISAVLTIEITNSSTGDYFINGQGIPWTEDTVVWDDFNPNIAGAIGIIRAGTSGIVEIALSAEWFQHYVNRTLIFEGINIYTEGSIGGTIGTNDGIDIASRESSLFKPKLEITYSEDPPELEELFAMVQELQMQVAELNQLKADLAGVKRIGDTIQFEGVNLQIVNGLGATSGKPDDPHSFDFEVNGLGNLIVGYNDVFSDGPPLDVTGSHNIVVGIANNYSKYGGIVIGAYNTISGQYSSVSGGVSNTASGFFSSVSGGVSNTASGESSSVGGGLQNTASGIQSHVSGGRENNSMGRHSTVGGGANRTATNDDEWVAGSLSEPN